jgi:hypothetical protein
MNLLTLREPFRTTCEKIFNPPPGEAIEWRAVRALFREIGETKWLPNGDLKVTRNGCELILRPPPSKDVGGPDELLELRRFIEASERGLLTDAFESPPEKKAIQAPR